MMHIIVAELVGIITNWKTGNTSNALENLFVDTLRKNFLQQHINSPVTGQLADKPTRGQSSRGLDNSRTGQLAEMFDLKFGVYNSSECYFGRITLFMPCQYSIGLE